MGRMLQCQMKSEEWQRGIGIPYLATYINQRRWEDDIKAPIPVPAREPAAVDDYGGYELWR